MSLWVLVTVSFLMIHLVPGDPVRAALGMTAPTELVEAKRQALGLDDPLLTQYVHYLGNLLHGDLGESITTQLPVSETIAQRLPATASLAVLAFLVAIAVAIPLGVAVAVATRRGRRRRTELAFAGSSVVLGSIPDFLVGVALVAVFAVGLGWFPVAGRDRRLVVRPARAGPGHRSGGRPGPHRPRRDALGAGDRLRPHGPGEEAPRPAHPPQARAAQRRHGDAHPRRHAAGLDDRRHGPGRERLRVARPGQHDRRSRS